MDVQGRGLPLSDVIYYKCVIYVVGNRSQVVSLDTSAPNPKLKMVTPEMTCVGEEYVSCRVIEGRVAFC
jgi:hypothetical protein